jgi:hypothetical protein
MVLTAYVAIQVFQVATRLILVRKPPDWSTSRTVLNAVGLAIVTLWLVQGVRVPHLDVPVLHRRQADVPERYFIAANLYNCQDLLPRWTAEVEKLAQLRE